MVRMGGFLSMAGAVLEVMPERKNLVAAIARPGSTPHLPARLDDFEHALERVKEGQEVEEFCRVSIYSDGARCGFGLERGALRDDGIEDAAGHRNGGVGTCR